MSALSLNSTLQAFQAFANTAGVGADQAAEFSGGTVRAASTTKNAFMRTFFPWKTSVREAININNNVRQQFLNGLYNQFCKPGERDFDHLPDYIKTALIGSHAKTGSQDFNLDGAGRVTSGKPLTARRIRAVMDAIAYPKELQKYDREIGIPEFGPIGGMFKDIESRDLALQILRLLDTSHKNFKEVEGKCFMSMLAEVVNSLRQDRGFAPPLTRAKMCEIFSIETPRNVDTQDKAKFTKDFLDGLYDRAINIVMRGHNQLGVSLAPMLDAGMRFQSIVQMLNDPNRGIQKGDFFIMPKPYTLPPEAKKNPAAFLEKRCYILGKDLERTPNVRLTFGGTEKRDEILSTDLKDLNVSDWKTLENHSEPQRTAAAKDIAAKIKKKCPRITDLQLAQLLYMPMQGSARLMKSLSPKLDTQDLNIDCIMDERNNVRVTFTPRGKNPDIPFKAVLVVSEDGTVIPESLQSGKGVTIRMQDWGNRA